MEKAGVEERLRQSLNGAQKERERKLLVQRYSFSALAPAPAPASFFKYDL